ncbi:hypothetical protein ACFVS2_25605 [Brevibacillus sp. NPDC058079]|uniref:hypothetical protein n=1 Tax=Brevibacillus sp. NPDC058079 TaxID=3346330 RepID=UPI0036E89740
MGFDESKGLDTMLDQVKIMVKEVLANSNEYTAKFSTKYKDYWENEGNRIDTQRRVGYYGIQVEYADGEVHVNELPDEEYLRRVKLKDFAHRKYCLLSKVKVKNKKIEAFLGQLEGFKEVQALLPYETKGTDTVIFLFPKDNQTKDWAGFALCDVLIYDRDYKEYFKLKTLSNGFTEILSNGIACRTGICDGGYMVRLRERCIIHETAEGSLFLLNVNTEFKQEYTEEEMEQALQDCFGKTFTNLEG